MVQYINIYHPLSMSNAEIVELATANQKNAHARAVLDAEIAALEAEIAAAKTNQIAALAAKDAEIAELEAEIAAIKNKPKPK